MGLRVAIQMDPVESIRPKTDSTLLLGLEAQKRGHELFYYTPAQLSMRENVVTARLRPITFFEDPEHYYEAGELADTPLDTMHVVLMRQDPPFDMTYITATHLLERIHPKTLVVNDPAAVRNAPEKILPLLFPEFMPPTLVSADKEAIADFRARHRDIVIKPLYGHGGNAVFRIREDDQNFNSLLEYVFLQSTTPWMVQRFLPEVKDGDRRIILADGEFVGVMGRIPAPGEIRANFRVGGSAAVKELTPQQKRICEALKPELKARGLIFTGLDVIGDYLTEINVTSPTGLRGINGLYNIQCESILWDAIEARLA